MDSFSSYFHGYLKTVPWIFAFWLLGRPGFDPWVGKIPWRRERLPTPVVWPGEFHGLPMGSASMFCYYMRRNII